MVYLSPDSRILVSLVKQEQAYSNQLHILLNTSGTSLSALAVYASSSPPAVSPVLNGVASALSGADEALRSYGEALNDWIDQLRTIKSKEEQVANIGRDREILVTRLLKVSHKSKSPPPSLLHAAPDSSSNISFPSFGSKITAAQAELQACESHLAEKERELEKHRLHAIRQGLKLRCEALVHCGWVWGEMGRRALSMLEDLSDVPMPANGHASRLFKSSPDPIHEHDHDSILSSLTPSQSASQMGVAPHSASLSSYEKSFRLDIPPPHLLSEHTTIPGPTMYTSKETDHGTSSSEDEGPVEVIENPRFQPASILHRQRSIRTAPSTPARSSLVPFPKPNKVYGTSSDVGLPTTSTQGKFDRDRKGTSFFGNIALLFRTSMNSKSNPSQRWSTRTDHLRHVRTDGENSSEDEPRAGRLRKGRARPSLKDSVEQDNTAQLPTISSLRIKNKTSGGKLDRSSADNSTVNEPVPVPVPRVRANTLTPSSGRVPGDGQGKPYRSHGRRASMDGRWGLSDGELGPSQTLGPTPVRKLPKQSTTNNPSSLMSIVEGVSQSNDDPSWRLEVVRAPGNEPPELPLLVHHPPPLSSTASAPASLVGTSVAQKRASMPNPPTFKPARDLPPAPAGKPLRSALRSSNRGRSVSPLPRVSTPNGNVMEEAEQTASATMSSLTLPEPAHPAPALPGLASASPTLRPSSISRPEIPSTIIESPRQSFAVIDTTVLQVSGQANGDLSNGHLFASIGASDTASISSYETGHETFDDDEVKESGSPAPAPPVPLSTSEKVVGLQPPSRRGPDDAYHPPPPHGNVSLAPNSTASEGLGVDEISSATSTETPTGATTTRRKSVRMSSLPPQVSATPPALDDEDEDRAPWGRWRTTERDEGWQTRISETGINGSNAWADSSSEDEVYKRARKALSKVERRLERKTR